MKDTVAIIVIAYNRPESLKRLLTSLAQAEYPSDEQIPLIISVDKSNCAEVAEAAEDFLWENGEKSVILREENLGLKKHVLTCGDMTEKYGSVIMLEDDLYVAPSFYQYTREALAFAAGQEDIGGISLYNHQLNVHVREPFEAIDDGYDNWYFQFASSWGQAFNREQWRAFREWLSENDGKALEAENMPKNVSSWSDKSWLKYYIKYLIVTNKYFLYPRASLTTNFSEEGTHAKRGETTADLQVALAGPGRHSYHFSSLSESEAVYDAFFENICLKQQLKKQMDIDEVNEMEIDLYGYKPLTEKRYLLTVRSLPYKQLISYRRALRPIDANIRNGLTGTEFFLYDLRNAGEAPVTDEVHKYLYEYKALKAKTIYAVLKYRLRQRFQKD